MKPALQLVFPETIALSPLGAIVDGRALFTLMTPVPIGLRLFDGRELHLFTIPAGTKTDGLSVPRPAIWWQDPFGLGWQAALPHDYLLQRMAAGVVAGPKILVDLVFLLALLSLGASFPRAAVMFLAVRTRRRLVR